MAGHDTRLALGGSLFMLACAPRVPATIVVPEGGPQSEPAAEPEAEAKAQSKAEARKAKRAKAEASGPDHSPPTIIRAEFVSESILRLHFSEPIEAPTGLDPNDFRISSMSVYIDNRGGYAYASYYDFGYQATGQPLRFVAARVGSVEIDLEFAPPVMLHYCRQFDYADGYRYMQPGVHADDGLFLHYAAGSIPIRDESGNALASFGADWVRRGHGDPPETRQELTGTAARGVGKSLIEIDCGMQLPDGPR